MKTSINAGLLAAILALPLLTGCNKDKDAPVELTAPTAPTAPDKPAAVMAPSASTDQGAATVSGTGAVGANAASASVGSSVIEAKAGDVSVKLPN